MLPVVLRRLSRAADPDAPTSGRCKTAPLFVPGYRSILSIRINARPVGEALARRKLGRLLETRRRVS